VPLGFGTASPASGAASGGSVVTIRGGGGQRDFCRYEYPEYNLAGADCLRASTYYYQS